MLGCWVAEWLTGVVQPSNCRPLPAPPASGLASGVTSPSYWGPSSNNDFKWDKVVGLIKIDQVLIFCCLVCVECCLIPWQPAPASHHGGARGWWGLSTSGSGSGGPVESREQSVWACGDTRTEDRIESSILRVFSLSVFLGSSLGGDMLIRPGGSWGLHSQCQLSPYWVVTRASANLDQCCTPSLAPAPVMTNSGGCCMIPSWSLVPGLS